MTMNPMRDRKVASRFLLPVEMFLGYLTTSIGVSALFMSGSLRKHLELFHMEQEYGTVYMAFGLWMFFVSALEWTTGKRWCVEWIQTVVTCRAASAFFTGVAWLLNVYLVFRIDLVFTAPSLLLITPAVCVVCMWSFWENVKVSYALNPRLDTPGLHFHR